MSIPKVLFIIHINDRLRSSDKKSYTVDMLSYKFRNECSFVKHEAGRDRNQSLKRLRKRIKGKKM